MADATVPDVSGLTDCHAHLVDDSFREDLDAVLERARRAGVERVIAVGETIADAERNLELTQRFPGFVRACAGLYPTILDLDQAAALEQWIRDHRDGLIGIGEVGLDRWKVQDPDDLDLQRRIFRGFVDLAIELDLPLNVHSRSAGRQTIELLREAGARRVLLHAFDGKAGKSQPALEAGYFFSVPPSVVRSPQKQKLVRFVPLENLLLETDSPVLGAVAGERNEPAEVLRSLQAIAQLKQVPPFDVARVTSDNARRLFGD